MTEFKDHGSWVRVRIDKEFGQFLLDSRIFSVPRGTSTRWTDANFVSFHKTTEVEPYSAVYMGEPLYNMGSFSYVTTPFNINAEGLLVKVGRYCSIGGGARIVGNQHPITAASSTTAFFDKDVQFVDAYIKDNDIADYRLVERPLNRGSLTIGHDVWFGGDTMFNRGLKIGDGAIVAANSHITKDVPDYAIVGGNPARIIRYRFPAEIIVELQKIRMWNYNLKTLQQFDLTNIENFIVQMNNAQPTLQTYAPPQGPALGCLPGYP